MHGTGTALIRHTASEVHGGGAGIIPHGTGTHGPIRHGTITAGTTDGMEAGTEAGMIRGITEASTTHGTMAMLAGTEDSTVHITADGTEAGIRSGRECIRVITIRDIIIRCMSTHGEDQGIRQDRTGCTQEEPQAAEVSARHRHHAGICLRVRAEQYQELRQRLQEAAASAGQLHREGQLQ